MADDELGAVRGGGGSVGRGDNVACEEAVSMSYNLQRGTFDKPCAKVH